MITIQVDGIAKYPRLYWPQELKRVGFVGEMEVYNDTITAVVIHPDAELGQVIMSLGLLQQVIGLRINKEGGKLKAPVEG